MSSRRAVYYRRIYVGTDRRWLHNIELAVNGRRLTWPRTTLSRTRLRSVDDWLVQRDQAVISRVSAELPTVASRRHQQRRRRRCRRPAVVVVSSLTVATSATRRMTLTAPASHTTRPPLTLRYTRSRSFSSRSVVVERRNDHLLTELVLKDGGISLPDF